MKSVLITGANRGIGLEFVRHYLTADHRVIATRRNAGGKDGLDRLAESHDARLSIEEFNVSDDVSIERLGATLKSRDFQPDIVINNAGVSIEEPFGSWTSRTFDQSLRVNAVGPALLAQAIAPMMAPDGKIIQISSGMGSIGLNLNANGPLDAYAVSKAALNILTARLATKLRHRDITIVAMNPGWVRTDMGGPDAPLSTAEAVGHMVKTIEALTIERTGSFISNEGVAIPW